VKELREKKAQKEKKLREKEAKRQQRNLQKQNDRDMYKWLDDWTPVVPTAGVDADDNNANNINNASAAEAAAARTQHLHRSRVTAEHRTRRPPPPQRHDDLRAPARSTDRRSKHGDVDNRWSRDAVTPRHVTTCCRRRATDEDITQSGATTVDDESHGEQEDDTTTRFSYSKGVAGHPRFVTIFSLPGGHCLSLVFAQKTQL